MNQTFTPVARLTTVVALLDSLAAVAAVTPNPYGRIPESNVFRSRLKPAQKSPKFGVALDS